VLSPTTLAFALVFGGGVIAYECVIIIYRVKKALSGLEAAAEHYFSRPSVEWGSFKLPIVAWVAVVVIAGLIVSFCGPSRNGTSIIALIRPATRIVTEAWHPTPGAISGTARPSALQWTGAQPTRGAVTATEPSSPVLSLPRTNTDRNPSCSYAEVRAQTSDRELDPNLRIFVTVVLGVILLNEIFGQPLFGALKIPEDSIYCLR
jgi:hypothetical protein